ncbi:DUF2750 domain-containing protein [Metabacillus sediminilitoris]|uniref:DUF2750 domain-containing protein n=1 Tax=Metabacillus sediminilitoris TaxID=2567941 RepID=A0A4S4BP72_9BACI|nr:DUF2750 domain-containing protein [Metabacillus sediminilitoris]QGQ45789.1 DUF2750 domain-containing protein [Metabacillus sediminilitoris]THF74345.1 DUF2750 domain-containing protein [Metabacillus sediminilitoris]
MILSLISKECCFKQPPNIRYKDFIRKVVDSEVVWGLYNEGWATGHDEEGNTLIQFFSKKGICRNLCKE